MNTYQWAKKYIELGWAIFPIHSIDANGCCTCGKKDCGDAGKHPRVRRGLKEASKDPAQIEEWFGVGAPLSNIGVVTGAISGITVIDIDIGDGKLGAETWAELTKEEGEPETLIAKTGSGGMHYVFKYNSVMRTSSNTLGPGVDCRNDGGYIVATPARHRSGGIYSWVNAVPVIDLPRYLTKKKDDKRGRPKKEDSYFRQKYTIEQVKSMLEFVSAEDRDVWRSVGIILGRQFLMVEEAWDVYVEWAAQWGGKEGRNHTAIMHEAFYDISQKDAEKELTLGTLVRLAIDGGWSPKAGEVPIDSFLFYGPGNNFIYRPTIAFWVAEAVNSAVSPVNDEGKLIKPSDWLRSNALTTSMTKDPGIDGDLIRGYDSLDGTLVESVGAAVFNAYRPPTIEAGDNRLAGPFLDHVRKIFQHKGDADQFLDYMAHRVQKPWEKPRFALLIAGDQGVGKDTAVEFCCPALGAWNVSNVEPSAIDSGFNEYASYVLVRISEAANLHDMSRWAFNESMKVLIAGQPDYVMINPKYGQKYSVRMHCGVIITTNHMLSGIYIPQDDRRYDVIESANKWEMGLEDDDVRREYFSELWQWFLEGGGDRHVAAYLRSRDISQFSAANSQRKTDAHKAVVVSGLTTDHWCADALLEIGDPKIVRADWLINIAARNTDMKLGEIKAKLSHSMGRMGYRFFRSDRKDGRTRIGDKLHTIYHLETVTIQWVKDQIESGALNDDKF
jgi:hypothetical protein